MIENANEELVISSYTRAEALADKVLYDVTATAREAGFKVPVAVTAAVYHEVIDPPMLFCMPGQDVAGRLWDVLWMARMEAGTHPNDFQFSFPVSVQTINAKGVGVQKTVFLKATIGPGDAGEPVVTIMWPNED